MIRTTIDAESILCVAKSWLSILCAHIGTFKLAILSSKLMNGVEAVFAITLVINTFWIRFVNGYAFGTMQTDVLSSRTDIQLMLTLDTKVSIGTNTMLEVNIGLIVVVHVGTEL